VDYIGTEIDMEYINVARDSINNNKKKSVEQVIQDISSA
jgi:hypothetical protein